jgi:GntR family transcriptional repressor for pyruvate dehydrogenase complex
LTKHEITAIISLKIRYVLHLDREVAVNDKKNTEKLFLSTFRQIRAHIIKNKLQPGDLLPTEQSMANHLNVSRNVVREAIKSMELMGMVKAVPGRGTEVCSFNLDFIFQNVLFFHMDGSDNEAVHQMFGIRRSLELAYMRPAFDALSREDIVHIRETMEKIRCAWEQEGLFSELDREFHMSIFRPLGNQVLLSLMDAIWSVDVGFQLELKRPHLPDSIARHEAIAAALEEYDYMSFAQAMLQHFSSGKYTRHGTYQENV